MAQFLLSEMVLLGCGTFRARNSLKNGKEEIEGVHTDFIELHIGGLWLAQEEVSLLAENTEWGGSATDFYWSTKSAVFVFW